MRSRYFKYPTAAFWLGGAGILTQTLLFRELSNILRANELILGLLLSVWLISAGFGGMFRPRKIKASSAILMVFVASSLSIPWLYTCARLLSPGIGRVWPFPLTLLLIVLSVFPQAYFVGSTFGALSERRRLGPDASHTYIFEGLGSFFGGVLSLVLASTVRPDIALPVFSIIALATVNPLEIGGRRIWQIFTALAVLILMPSMFFIVESSARAIKGSSSLKRFESKIGAIEVSHNRNDIDIYQSGTILGNTGDSLEVQDILHPLLVASSNSPRVALVGGILQGAARIALEYEPESLFVTIEDPRLLEVGYAYLTSFRALDNPSVRVVFGDPRRTIANAPDSIDLVFIYSSLPSSSSESRLVGNRMFERIAKKISPEGRVAVGFPISPNYLTPEELSLVGSVLASARSVFGQAEAYIVESYALIVAPDDSAFGARIVAGDFPEPRSSTINRAMIQASIEEFRQRDLRDRLSSTPIHPNTDTRPIAYLIGLRLWERLAGGILIRVLSSPSIVFWAIFFIALFTAILLTGKVFRSEMPSLATAISAMGFLGMGTSILILYGFQAIVGRLYSAVGLLSSLFILGTVFGAKIFANERRSPFLWSIAAIPIIPLVFAVFRLEIATRSTALSILFFGFVMLYSGFACGAFYSLALRLAFAHQIWGNKAPAKTYAFDLIGASVAATLVGVVFIPSFGIERTLSLLIIFVIFALMKIFVTNSQWRKNGQYE